MVARGPSIIPLRDRPDGHFAANLTFLLERRGMDAADLARVLDESPRRIRRLARGETLPHYNEIPRIARELEVAAADLAWTPTDRFRARLARPCARCNGTRRVPGVFGTGFHRPCPDCL